MLLSWEHDGEEWDPFTILGKITLNGDLRGQIHDDNLTLDSWLIGLARGFIELRSGKREVSIDTLDEPDGIQLQLKGETLSVTWGDQHSEISNLEVACASLAAQLQALADDLREQAPPRDETTIKELGEYAAKLVN